MDKIWLKSYPEGVPHSVDVSQYRSVTQLLEEIDTTQPNMSQHLNTLYQAGVIGKRREGVQIFYRIINDRVVTLCRAVCTQIAIEADVKG